MYLYRLKDIDYLIIIIGKPETKLVIALPHTNI